MMISRNFKVFRGDRPGDHHGGVCIYVRDKVFFVGVFFFKKKTQS